MAITICMILRFKLKATLLIKSSPTSSISDSSSDSDHSVKVFCLAAGRGRSNSSSNWKSSSSRSSLPSLCKGALRPATSASWLALVFDKLNDDWRERGARTGELPLTDETDDCLSRPRRLTWFKRRQQSTSLWIDTTTNQLTSCHSSSVNLGIGLACVVVVVLVVVSVVGALGATGTS